MNPGPELISPSRFAMPSPGNLRESEERFSGAFEHAPIGVALVLPDGRWLKVNRAVCDLFGYSELELLARTFQDITHPEDLETDLENVRQMLAGDIRSYRMEKRYFHAHGHLVTTLLSVSLVRDGRDQPLYFISQIQDITERKRIEEALKESETRHHALFENMLEGCAYCQLLYEGDRACDYIYRQVNGAFEPLTGLKNVVGKRVSEVVPGMHEANPEQLEIYSRVARTGQPEQFESYVEPLKIWFAVSVYSHEQEHFVAVFENITERKLSEVRLAEAHRQLVEASRLAGRAEMATGVLHNVGNVLNSVNVASNCVAVGMRKSKSVDLARVVALLAEHQSDLGTFFTSDPRGKLVPGFLANLSARLAREQSTALQELANLQKNIHHIKEIVAMQQSCAKISEVAEMVQIPDLIEDTLRMSAESMANDAVRVVRDFRDVPAVVVEKHKVLQILVNLVRNAKHACAAVERPDKTLTLRVFNGDDRVKIAVSDNGIGIPAENLARIFCHGFTTKPDGHGFGLHSGMRAAEEMGGALRVESSGPGEGATFTLELPLRLPGYPSERPQT